MAEQEYGPQTREQLFAELKEIVVKSLKLREGEDMYDTDDRVAKMNSLLNTFKTENPDWKDYALFHLATGSSEYNKAPKWDTDKHELEKLIRSLPEKE